MKHVVEQVQPSFGERYSNAHASWLGAMVVLTALVVLALGLRS